MQVTEHPFAQYIKILGKGRNGSRALTRNEAYDAMSMFACYEAEPEQLGAFMSLMRMKEETPDELAGFSDALRKTFAAPDTEQHVVIDWPVYAGKRRQLPWFILAALLLGRNGYTVFMHGLKRDDGRIYAEDALQALGIQNSNSLTTAVTRINQTGFAYMKIDKLSPVTAEMLQTRELLGLRSPVNTVARMLNPLTSSLMIQGIFHPNYARLHQQAGSLLQQPNLVAFRGEGGEAERVPDRSCKLSGITNNELWEDEWEALLPPGKYIHDKSLDLDHFIAVWEGRKEDVYAEMAVVGTIAIIFRTLGLTINQKDSFSKAEQLWHSRHASDVAASQACQGA